MREHYPGETIPTRCVAVNNEDVTVVVLLWDSHLGAEEVLVRNLFNRGNINKVRDVGFDPVFVFGEFTELDSQVGVRVVCACGVANKMEFVFLVQSTEGGQVE